MYKLLFAEDETATREGVLDCIDWRSLGITDIRSAKNGMAALALTNDWIPDILLTDIRMPRMNGIDLCMKIRELNPNCSILLISGYSEVEYLKSAIKLKAIDFVDKPLEISVLEEQLKNAVAEQEMLEQQRNYIRQDICRLFLHEQNLASLVANFQLAQFPLSLTDFCCNFSLHILSKNQHILGQTTGADAYFSLLNSYLSSQDFYHTGMVMDENLILLQIYRPDTLSPGSKELDPAILYPAFHSLWQENFDASRNELHVCAGPVVPIMNYTQTFQQSLLQRNNIFLHSSEYFHYSSTPQVEESISNTSNLRHLLQELERFLFQKNLAAMQNTQEKLLLELKGCYNLSRKSILYAYSNMLFSFLQQQEQVSLSSEHVYDDLSECTTIEDANRCLLEYAASYQIAPKPGLSLTDEIIQIIHEQYAKRKLSLDDISQQVHLSPSYICVKFKEETGKTLTQYINEYRIETSLSLLASPENKINLIAEQVGFDNGNYYAKIFKKIKKMSPAEYRETQYSVRDSSTL